MGPNGWTEIEELFPVVPSYGQGMEQGWKAGWLLKRITEGDPRLYSGGANLGLAGNQRVVEPGLGFPNFPLFTPPAIPFLPDPTGEDVLPPVSSGGGGVTPPEPPASSGGPTVSSGGPIGPGGPSGSTSGGPVSTSYSTSTSSQTTSTQSTSTQSTSTLSTSTQSTSTLSTSTTSATTTSTSEVFDDCNGCLDCSDFVTIEIDAVYPNPAGGNFTVTGTVEGRKLFVPSPSCNYITGLEELSFDVQGTDDFGNLYIAVQPEGFDSDCSTGQGTPRSHRWTGSIRFESGPVISTSMLTEWVDTSGQECIDGVYPLAASNPGTGTLTVSGSG